MPRFLAVGHVTWDRRDGGDVLGGAVSYGSLAALRLGCECGVLTAAGPDFEPTRDLPGVSVFWRPGRVTTRFANEYDEEGERRQMVLAKAEPVDPAALPDAWRGPETLLLAPVVGELGLVGATAFEAECVGAVAQGWLRAIAPDGRVSPRDWEEPARDLAGVHVLFLSERDLPGGGAAASSFLELVPMVVVTRGWHGARLLTREATFEIPAYPRPEVDPTGAGDVFAAAFLVRYHEAGDPLEAAAYAACAASCVVEGVGTSRLGDRAEVERRCAERERCLEEGALE